MYSYRGWDGLVENKRLIIFDSFDINHASKGLIWSIGVYFSLYGGLKDVAEKKDKEACLSNYAIIIIHLLNGFKNINVIEKKLSYGYVAFKTFVKYIKINWKKVTSLKSICWPLEKSKSLILKFKCLKKNWFIYPMQWGD